MRTALSSLAANKSRSILTMLGVIIGVAAVLIVVAIGEGLKADTLDRIRSLGTNLIMVFPGGGSGWRSTRPGELTEEDVEALRAGAEDLSAIAPVVQTSATAKYRNLTHDTQVVGTNAEWATVMAFARQSSGRDRAWRCWAWRS
jgi:ABC-type antimicrobial peptide transport system permease subunit